MKRFLIAGLLTRAVTVAHAQNAPTVTAWHRPPRPRQTLRAVWGLSAVQPGDKVAPGDLDADDPTFQHGWSLICDQLLGRKRVCQLRTSARTDQGGVVTAGHRAGQSDRSKGETIELRSRLRIPRDARSEGGVSIGVEGLEQPRDKLTAATPQDAQADRCSRTSSSNSSPEPLQSPCLSTAAANANAIGRDSRPGKPSRGIGTRRRRRARRREPRNRAQRPRNQRRPKGDKIRPARSVASNPEITETAQPRRTCTMTYRSTDWTTLYAPLVAIAAGNALLMLARRASAGAEPPETC